MTSSWISPKAEKGIISGIAGRGLFATERIGADEIVAVKGGHIVTTWQLRQLPDPLPNSEIQIAIRDIAAGEELTIDYAFFDDSRLKNVA